MYNTSDLNFFNIYFSFNFPNMPSSSEVATNRIHVCSLQSVRELRWPRGLSLSAVSLLGYRRTMVDSEEDQLPPCGYEGLILFFIMPHSLNTWVLNSQDHLFIFIIRKYIFTHVRTIFMKPNSLRDPSSAHHHVLEGLGDKERHAPVGEDAGGTGDPPHFGGEDLRHDQPRDGTPTESKT